MDFYTAHLLAQAKHEDMLRELRHRKHFYDYGSPDKVFQLTRLARQMRRLLDGTRNRLVALANRREPGQNTSVAASGVQTKTQEIPI